MRPVRGEAGCRQRMSVREAELRGRRRLYRRQVLADGRLRACPGDVVRRGAVPRQRPPLDALGSIRQRADASPGPAEVRADARARARDAPVERCGRRPRARQAAAHREADRARAEGARAVHEAGRQGTEPLAGLAHAGGDARWPGRRRARQGHSAALTLAYSNGASQASRVVVLTGPKRASSAGLISAAFPTTTIATRSGSGMFRAAASDAICGVTAVTRGT